MSALKQYLGDSVYADYDEAGNAIVLTTENENGYGPSNTIVLDANTLSGLESYQKWLDEQLLARANSVKSNAAPQWWAYLHSNGSVQVKRWFGDVKDYTEDCEGNDFVVRVVPPFDAANRDEAAKIAVERLQ